MVARYTKAQGLFRTDDSPDPIFTDTLELDMSTVEPSLAGPKRPQDRIRLADMKASFEKMLTAPNGPQGLGLDPAKVDNSATIEHDGSRFDLTHGDVVHRRHHLLHQHQQPQRDDRGRDWWRRKRSSEG